VFSRGEEGKDQKVDFVPQTQAAQSVIDKEDQRGKDC
jgi:hypothetical protein